MPTKSPFGHPDRRPKNRNGGLRPPRPLPDPRRVWAYPRPPPRALAASVVRLQTSTLVPSAGRGTSSRHVFARQRPERHGAVEPASVRDRWVDARALRRRIVRHRGPEAVKSAIFCANMALQPRLRRVGAARRGVFIAASCLGRGSPLRWRELPVFGLRAALLELRAVFWLQLKAKTGSVPPRIECGDQGPTQKPSSLPSRSIRKSEANSRAPVGGVTATAARGPQAGLRGSEVTHRYQRGPRTPLEGGPATLSH